MFHCLVNHRTTRQGAPKSCRDRSAPGAVLCLLLAGVQLSVAVARANPSAAMDGAASRTPFHFLTNVVQFQTLPSEEFLDSCAFHLTGVVTMVDTNRNLLVLQDETGQLAVHSDQKLDVLQFGQLVSIEGTNSCPYVTSFPAYPYSPSGWDIRTSLEAPSDWGDYHMTRMRGYLHPPITGEYTFWIASDNSSELWLSSSEYPNRIRRIAFISPSRWVTPHDWFRYPSQRSEPVLLKGGQTYYIEAFQEQMTESDNLAVAWQGPQQEQAVIDGRYLTPWIERPEQAPYSATNGILREYWTNYVIGSLIPVTGARLFESAISVKEMKLSVLGEGILPAPRRIALGQNLLPTDNYRWVETTGWINFAGKEGDAVRLEITDGSAQAQVRVRHWNRAWSPRMNGMLVRVQGVCESVQDERNVLVAGHIFAPTDEQVIPIDSEGPSWDTSTSTQPNPAPSADTNGPLGGYYWIRGVVTFNDNVLGKDSLFVQQDNTALFIARQGCSLPGQPQVGDWVEVGGHLLTSYKPGQGLSPVTFTRIGGHSLPAPGVEPVQMPVPGNRDGRWTEIEGVARSVKPDGTLTLMGKGGPIALWVGKTDTNLLDRYVDSLLRVRGVLSLQAPHNPLLLIPSRQFIDIEEEPAGDPFVLPSRTATNLFSENVEPWCAHRVKMSGTVIYRQGQTLFVQDESGGTRVKSVDDPRVQIGERVYVAGFCSASGAARTLSDALVRPTGVIRPVTPVRLDLGKGARFEPSGVLVDVRANLLVQKTEGATRVLVLQEEQRIFEAVLSGSETELPSIAGGSRLNITGISDFEDIVEPVDGRPATEKSSANSFKIWLRDANDIVILRGPPWWTLKRTVSLVGMLLAVLFGVLLWVHLLHRRLERQQAARLAFSRQILQGQESERTRIAANLHDSLGQNLLVIKNQATLARQPRTDEGVLKQRLDEISKVATQAIEEVRQITLGLRPYQLGRLGLSQALQATVAKTSENCPILFASHVDDIDAIFDSESEIHVYRIVQEAINNIVKHSAATEAAVVVKKQAEGVCLSIRDNGRGFDPAIVYASASTDVGYGLTGISERVRILGGTLAVETHPGHGVNLTVEIPLPAPRHDTTNQSSDRG